MVRSFRRLVAVALVAGVTLMNVQAAELHTHSAVSHADDTHHHGPASHHHDADHQPSDTARVAAVNADDTVVHVALVAASPQSVKPLQVANQEVRLFDGGIPSIIAAARIVARAHGPPSTVQHSLRAPPSFPSR